MAPKAPPATCWVTPEGPKICDRFRRSVSFIIPFSGPGSPWVAYWPLGDSHQTGGISVDNSCISGNGGSTDTRSTPRGARLRPPRIGSSQDHRSDWMLGSFNSPVMGGSVVRQTLRARPGRFGVGSPYRLQIEGFVRKRPPDFCPRRITHGSGPPGSAGRRIRSRPDDPRSGFERLGSLQDPSIMDLGSSGRPLIF